MTSDAPLSPQEFGASFKNFMEKVAAQAPSHEPPLAKRLREHFGRDASGLPVVSEKFRRSNHASVQIALDAWLAEGGRAHDLVGIVSAFEMMSSGLAQLVAPPGSGHRSEMAPNEGPVQYANLPVGDDRKMACVELGLYLVREGDRRFALLLTTGHRSFGEGLLTVEVMAADREAAERLLAVLRSESRKRSIYRGKVVSLGFDHDRDVRIDFHTLQKVDRQDIVLPEGLLERIERVTIGFSDHAARLAESGRHLKRGLLLHGPPGTGKTLTAMHLAGRMTNRTVILLTGDGLALVGPSCSMARTLQPATIILEDVDLIAEERSGGNKNSVLFELLNQMDGLAPDADVLFILTTNRPDILEPALASRPGRVDQAFEIPLPDAAGRRRLMDLYGRGLVLRLADRERVIQRTEGVSAAFIREVLRKSAVIAAEAGGSGPIAIEDRHLEEALHELLVEGGELTKSLLGFSRKTPLMPK